MTTNKSLIKEHVCTQCLSLTIKDPHCICTYESNYDTIELEFEVCKCCNRIIDEVASTEFNKQQLKKLEDGNTTK